MTAADLAALVCPLCTGDLSFEGTFQGGHVADGTLACGGCGRAWPVRDGVPHLVPAEQVAGFARLVRLAYDGIAPIHDLAVATLLRLIDGSSEAEARDFYLRRLRLHELAVTPDRPRRILEIGIGTGANLPLLARWLPPRAHVELWGVDFSAAMLARCRARLCDGGLPPVRLALADAHCLPFGPASFDRVFHVGAIGTYRSPRRALAEMARVARPGTPVVVVDERLDRRRPPSLCHRALFRALTFYDAQPEAPVDQLPDGVVSAADEQINPFYYCLTFSTGDRRANGEAISQDPDARLRQPPAGD